jgi:hypothetical protein
MVLVYFFIVFWYAGEESMKQMTMWMKQMTLRMEEAEKHWKDLIKTSGQCGKGLSVRFEQYVRGILAT